MDDLNIKAKRLIIVSYFYPPQQQSVPYPTSSWVKYLLALGWEITVLTSNPLSSNISVDRGSYCVYRVPDKQLFSKLVTLRDGLPSFSIAAKLINFFLQNFLLFPDSKRGWCKTAITKGLSLIKENDIKVILGVGTPWTDFLVASGLSKKAGIPWIADYRDAWTQKTFWKRSIKWVIRDMINRIIELNVCGTANKIIHASDIWADQLRKMFKKKEIVVIPNGYDPDFFEKVGHIIPNKDKFTLSYIGHAHFIQRIDIFFKGFERFVKQNKLEPEHCQLMFVESQNIENMFRDFKIARKFLHAFAPVPIEKAIEYMKSAHVLLLFMSDLKGWYPTKAFEYLAASRPVLATPNDNGVISELLEKTGAGISLNTQEEVCDWLGIAYSKFKMGEDLDAKRNIEAVEQFSRESLTKQLDKILSKVIR